MTHKTSEIIHVNFKTGLIEKMVETDNTTGEVVAEFMMIENPEDYHQFEEETPDNLYSLDFYRNKKKTA